MRRLTEAGGLLRGSAARSSLSPQARGFPHLVRGCLSTAGVERDMPPLLPGYLIHTTRSGSPTRASLPPLRGRVAPEGGRAGTKSRKRGTHLPAPAQRRCRARSGTVAPLSRLAPRGTLPRRGGRADLCESASLPGEGTRAMGEYGSPRKRSEETRTRRIAFRVFKVATSVRFKSTIRDHPAGIKRGFASAPRFGRKRCDMNRS